MPILQAVNEFNDFCNASIKEPLLSRIGRVIDALKRSAAPLRASTSEKVRAIGKLFEDRVAFRFDVVLT
jgi:hypothetical protein